MRIAILSFTVLFLVACAAQTTKSPAQVLAEANSTQSTVNITVPGKNPGTYYIDTPDVSELAFHGQRDSVGVSGEIGGMAYPAYDAASFLVAIATHAAISGAMKNSKRNNAIEAADLVTKPYLDITQQLTTDILLNQSILMHMASGSPTNELQLAEKLPSTNSWYTRVSPIFIMASSEDSIIIKNKVEIMESRYLDSNNMENVVYSKTIYFQSTPLENKSLWLQSNGERFKSTLNELLLTSIQLALYEFSQPENDKPAVSTIRYLDNGKKKIERGRLLTSNCTHVTFESLKGELKSMPQLPKFAKDLCIKESQES